MDITGLGNIADLGSKLIDRLWPDQASRDAAKIKLLEMQQTGELAILTATTDLAKAQIDVNKEEAKSEDKFVTRGRPFVIWVCGIAFMYASILEPLMRFISTVYFHYMGIFPQIDTALTIQILFGLLGLGAMRSWEKGKGVA